MTGQTPADCLTASRRLITSVGIGTAGSQNYPNNNRNSNNNRYPNDNRYPTNNSYNSNLTGTYQLDTARSENTRDIADRAVGSGSSNSDDTRRDLENKLEAPAQIAVDVRGSQVTLGSSNAKQITFAADGSSRTETLDNGKTLRVRTTLRGQELTVSSVGGENDYTVTFTSIDNGNSSARDAPDYGRVICVRQFLPESIYKKTDTVARFDGYDNSDGGYSGNDGSYSSNDPNDNRNNYPGNNRKRLSDDEKRTHRNFYRAERRSSGGNFGK